MSHRLAGELRCMPFGSRPRSAATAKCFTRTVSNQHGRHVRLHHQEARLHAARAWQRSSEFDDFRKRRQVVEHRIARLVQLGIRQARYVGRRKTLFQVLLADAVANLTLVASHAARMTQTGSANRPLGAVLAARRRLSRPLCRQPRVAPRRSFRQRSWQARSVTAVYPVQMAVFRPSL